MEAVSPVPAQARIAAPQGGDASSVSALLAGLRNHGRQLLAASDDPHAELLALVWGNRFDREHAVRLLGQPPATTADLPPHLARAADGFDRLPGRRQQQLRRLILRHRGVAIEGAP